MITCFFAFSNTQWRTYSEKNESQNFLQGVLHFRVNFWNSSVNLRIVFMTFLGLGFCTKYFIFVCFVTCKLVFGLVDLFLDGYYSGGMQQTERLKCTLLKWSLTFLLCVGNNGKDCNNEIFLDWLKDLGI